MPTRFFFTYEKCQFALTLFFFLEKELNRGFFFAKSKNVAFFFSIGDNKGRNHPLFHGYSIYLFEPFVEERKRMMGHPLIMRPSFFFSSV